MIVKMGSLFVTFIIILLFLSQRISSQTLEKEVAQLKGSQKLMHSEIAQLKLKIWTELAADIELIKKKLVVIPEANSDNSSVGSDIVKQYAELEKRLVEEIKQRQRLEERLEDQENTINLLLSGTKSQKEQIADLKQCCSHVKTDLTISIDNLKKKVDSNEEIFHDDIRMLGQVVEQINDTLDDMQYKLKEKAGKISIGNRIDSLEKVLSTSVNKVKQEVTTINEEIHSGILEKTRDYEFYMKRSDEEHMEIKTELRNCSAQIARVAAKTDCISKPTYISDWILMKSQDGEHSQAFISHGLGELPYKVDVQVQPTQGPNAGWIFPGTSVSQANDDHGYPYGGVVYFYNGSHVLLQAPKENNGGAGGQIVYTGQGGDKYTGSYHQSEGEARVRVKAWGAASMGHPDFISSWKPLNRNNKAQSYYDIQHGMNEYPAFVNVQVRCGTSKQSMVSEGIAASVTESGIYHNNGGIVWALGRSSVRIWSPYVEEDPVHGICGAQDGWGSNSGPWAAQGSVRILVWSRRQCLPGVSLFEEKNMITNFLSVDHDIFALYAQVNDGANQGFRFFSSGSVQAQVSPHGGAVFAYSASGSVRVWRPNPNKDGFLVHVNADHGGGTKTQSTNNATIGVVMIHAQT